jgi:hypothetical protein
MRHHPTQGKQLIAGEPFGRDHIKPRIIFGIAKYLFL